VIPAPIRFECFSLANPPTPPPEQSPLVREPKPFITRRVPAVLRARKAAGTLRAFQAAVGSKWCQARRGIGGSRTTHLSFDGIVLRAANATAHGDATIRTPATWPRKTLERHRAVFAPVPVAGSCTATASVLPDVAASRLTARALAAQAVPSSETVRQGGGATSAWRVGAAAAGVESPMRVYVWRYWRVAPRRFAAIRVNVLFASGCPTDAVNNSALQDAVARVARTGKVDVRFSPRRSG
jgi:hypothetical protein